MKITLIFLCIVIAALMEVQVNAAESSSSSHQLVKKNDKASALIRNKRGWWTTFISWVLPAVGCVLTIAAFVAAPLTGGATIPLMIAAGTFTAQRTISALANTIIDGIEDSCRKTLALTDTRSPEDTVEFNLEIIDTFINRNLNENNPLKLVVEKEHPELKNVVHFSTDGFHCDQKFCEKFGNGTHAFGVCSPYCCSCGINGAEGFKCINNLIYDPIYANCDIPTKVKVCGF